ncbi:DinB family protein [Flavobacterium sp.]
MLPLQKILNELEYQIPNFEKTNPTVSSSTVGWQIDHSLLVINSVIDQLKRSNPDDYKWKFNKYRVLIGITNTIPRGKVRVPKSVKPVEVATVEGLKAKIELARKNISDLDTLHPNSYFTHPFFGDLKLKTTIWFLKLHTNHHLKIMADILKIKNPET